MLSMAEAVTTFRLLGWRQLPGDDLIFANGNCLYVTVYSHGMVFLPSDYSQHRVEYTNINSIEEAIKHVETIVHQKEEESLQRILG